MLGPSRPTHVSKYHGTQLLSTAFGMHSNACSDEDPTCQYVRSRIGDANRTLPSFMIGFVRMKMSLTLADNPKPPFVNSPKSMTAINC